ncbi:YolD-like family protein [Bacillus sp. V2I10]|uniref:YolD-like family protein n=1 Tax=Bacillus sp. V2I10 TaxID=3042276 RepID=UPI0027858B6C|nr:YolD-like family protein [Bacillus sp. V2I10]MDQ0862130.1 hypothetical protein [Bacillus sp. V2I10]
MLRDRGKMKWQGFFMTEHLKLLWDMEEEYLKTARPLLDEGQIEDLERLLSESLQEKILLEIVTWKGLMFVFVELFDLILESFGVLFPDSSPQKLIIHLH